MIDKLTTEHLQRLAYIYIRQSTSTQVVHNRESQRLQYSLVERAKELGWHEPAIRLIDSDLGTSASGCVDRLGFEELLSTVCAGRIGAIISIEASRLARNGREWHTLLEMCGITNTLLIDHDTVYDLKIMNDRFLLGLKGEMSSMELNLLKERSQAALKEKAKRGELYLSVVAAYVKTPTNQLKKNPDRRVQEVTQLVFSKFREYGTMRQVLNWFLQEEIKVPVTSNGKGPRCIQWKLPGSSSILRILDNPIYAGAYVHGRTETRVTIENGRKRLKKGIRKEQKDWDVLIKDHHEGYISWQEYQKNVAVLCENANKERPVVKGAAGKGEALLTGLLRCGHCGGKLIVRYAGGNGGHRRYQCSKKRIGVKEKQCLSFGGVRVDREVTCRVLGVLSSIGLEASLKAIEKLNKKSGTVQRQRELELEQARYESLLAQRRYNAVDPDNRLVASTLEKEWNDALVHATNLENEMASLNDSTLSVCPEERARIMELSQDLPGVWNDPSSPPELKKRILRTVIKEIIVYQKDPMIHLVIHWAGGDHTELEVVKNKSYANVLRTDVETETLISELARIMPDKQIVAFLNRLGKTTAKGHTWNPVRLRAFRCHRNIPVYREGERQERDELTVDEASLILAIGKTKAWRLIHHNILPARQICDGAPWIISKKDIESDVVKKAAHSPLSKRLPEVNQMQQLFDF